MAHTTTREQKTRMLCTAGLMAALACVSNFISIATPASRIHIGNAVCVLCGLILGPAYGFFAAGVGNAIFDIIGGYGMEFVITFINKGAIALVTGLIAYKAAGKNPRGQGSRPRDRRQHPRRADLHRAVPAQVLHQAALHHGGRRSVALQATMLSRRRAACSTPRSPSWSRRSSLTCCASRCAASACTARIKPARPTGSFWPASKAGLFCDRQRPLPVRLADGQQDAPRRDLRVAEQPRAARMHRRLACQRQIANFSSSNGASPPLSALCSRVRWTRTAKWHQFSPSSGRFRFPPGTVRRHMRPARSDAPERRAGSQSPAACPAR